MNVCTAPFANGEIKKSPDRSSANRRSQQPPAIEQHVRRDDDDEAREGLGLAAIADPERAQALGGGHEDGARGRARDAHAHGHARGGLVLADAVAAALEHAVRGAHDGVAHERLRDARAERLQRGGRRRRPRPAHVVEQRVGRAGGHAVDADVAAGHVRARLRERPRRPGGERREQAPLERRGVELGARAPGRPRHGPRPAGVAHAAEARVRRRHQRPATAPAPAAVVVVDLIVGRSGRRRKLDAHVAPERAHEFTNESDGGTHEETKLLCEYDESHWAAEPIFLWHVVVQYNSTPQPGELIELTSSLDFTDG